MTTTAIAAVPTMDGGAFDADWLLQPQGEARRLEAALPQLTVVATALVAVRGQGPRAAVAYLGPLGRVDIWHTCPVR